MLSRGLTFIYVDYGYSNLDTLNIELRYSLTSLLHLKSDAPLDVVIYTDKPSRYRDLPVRIVDIASKTREFSLEGRYHHRIKPCVLLEEMKNSSNYCVMVDTDTFFENGFLEKLRRTINDSAVAMDLFHGRNTFPALAGFSATLPHAGLYSYDPANSVEYNSGLIAVDPSKHLPVIEDAIALIDAVLAQDKMKMTLEQIALSECLRVHQVQIVSMRPTFRHYYPSAHKRYMHWHIRRWLERNGKTFAPSAPAIAYTKSRIRFFRLSTKLNWSRLKLISMVTRPRIG